MTLSDLSATALQSNPVVLNGDTSGARVLPAGTDAANRAAAEAVVRLTQPTYNIGLLLAIIGIVATAINVRKRRRG